MGRFIKFACNQDRLPLVGGAAAASPPPPYPMKIAPHDKRDEVDPDMQLVRVETCMFMVKLPRYSTFETMREKLLYVINCATDPLSGWSRCIEKKKIFEFYSWYGPLHCSLPLQLLMIHGIPPELRPKTRFQHWVALFICFPSVGILRLPDTFPSSFPNLYNYISFRNKVIKYILCYSFKKSYMLTIINTELYKYFERKIFKSLWKKYSWFAAIFLNKKMLVS